MATDAHPGWPGSIWVEGDPAPTGSLVRVTRPSPATSSLARVLCTAGELARSPRGIWDGYFAVVDSEGEIEAVYPPRCVPVELDREGTDPGLLADAG